MPQVKVFFRLDRDDTGYPPVDTESVWANELPNGTCIMDNIPFFTTQATLGDLVEVIRIGEDLFYSKTIMKSRNSLSVCPICRFTPQYDIEIRPRSVWGGVG